MRLTQADYVDCLGIGDSTLQVWQERALDGRLENEKPIPETKPTSTDLSAVEKVLKALLDFPHWGKEKISEYLCNRQILNISPGTAQKIKNKLNKLLDPSEYNLSVLTRYEALNPSDMWAIDFLEFKWHGEKLYIAIIHDDNSRFVINWGITYSATTEFVIDLIDEAILTYGKPDVLKSDNGPQFRKQFRDELAKREIFHLNIPAYTPEYNGKLERLNRDVRHLVDELKTEELNLDLSAAIQSIDRAIHDHNNIRPHQALNGLTPAQRFLTQGLENRTEMQNFQLKDSEQAEKGTDINVSEKCEQKGIVAPIRRNGKTVLRVRTFSEIFLQKVLD